MGVANVTLSHTDYTGATTSWLISGAKIELTVDKPIGIATITHITISGPPAVIQA